jgi:hypothetical protein
MDNGEYFSRRAWNDLARYQALAPRERPEPKDTTGLKMLEEFLAKRKGERDGDERK